MDNEELIIVIKKTIEETLPIVLQEKVNGKIDRIKLAMDEHNAKHERDMERILPVLVAFENSERALESVQRGGKKVIGVSAFITAVGGAYLIIKTIFRF